MTSRFASRIKIDHIRMGIDTHQMECEILCEFYRIDVSTNFRAPHKTVANSFNSSQALESSIAVDGVRTIHKPERSLDFLHKNRLFVEMSLTFSHGRNC